MKQLLAFLMFLSSIAIAQEKQQPENMDILSIRGKHIQEYEKTRSEAVEKAQQDVSAHPDSAEAHFRLAEVYLRYFGPGRTHDEKIFAELQTAILLNSNYAEAYYQLAAYYNLQSDHKKQVVSLNKAISLKSGYAEAYCALGFTHLEERFRDGVKIPITEEELKLAVSAFKKAIQIKPDFTEAYNGLGDANYRLRLYEESLEAFHRAVLLHPNDIMGHLGIGSIHIELGNKEAAMKEYEALMKVATEYEAQSKERDDNRSFNPIKSWAEGLLKKIQERFGND